jgi:hypothetical protein
MQKMKRIGRLFLLVAMLGSVAVAADSNYVKPTDIDWEKLIGPPPKAGSDEQNQEIAKLLEWQAKRTTTDVDRCKAEETADPFIFSGVLGDKFTAKDLPKTASLLKKIQEDVKGITTPAKAKFERKRPPAQDERIKPCVKMEENGSYPSAHATRGVVWSRVLAEMFPDKKDALLKRGLLMGEDRVIAGIHFPSDVAAGQKLGDAIADKLLADPAFQAAMKEAKAECENAGVGK